MKKVLTRSEVISCLSLESGSWELLAHGEAHYDEGASELIIHLHTELRPVVPHPRHAYPYLDWVPADCSQRESVPLEEAFAVAKDIFQSWVNRIKLQLDHFHQPQTETETLTVRN